MFLLNFYEKCKNYPPPSNNFSGIFGTKVFVGDSLVADLGATEPAVPHTLEKGYLIRGTCARVGLRRDGATNAQLDHVGAATL
jgi:hypothetical protein